MLIFSNEKHLPVRTIRNAPKLSTHHVRVRKLELARSKKKDNKPGQLFETTRCNFDEMRD